MPLKKTLGITERLEFGSRPARRLRRAGIIPAVVYGRGGSELTVTVNEKEFMDVIGYSTSTGIINLKMGRKSPVTVIVRDVQWDIITDRPVHIDFLRVSEDQIVSVPVHIRLENIPVGVTMGGVLEHALHEILIKVRAKDIPGSVTVDVGHLEIGDTIHLSDIVLSETLTLDMDSDLVVASVVAPSVAKVEVEEEELLEGEEAAELEGEEEETDKESKATPTSEKE